MARNTNPTSEAKKARLAAIDDARRAKQEQYWFDRSQSRIRATDREADSVKRDQDRAYKTARRNVQREVDKVYRGIGAAAGMSEEDARQRLSQSELKDFKEELARKRDIIKDMIAKDPNNEELKKYDTEWENLSKVRELTRKEALQINIETEIAQLGGKQQMSIDKHASNVVSTSLKMNASDLDVIGGVQAKLGVGSPEQVERAAKENWQHGDFSDRIWADKEKLIKEVREVIENGFARNKGATDMATDLMNRMNVSHSNALRVVRTEFNHLSNQAALAEYQKKGIKKYKFVAAIDNRTCDVCHELHGKEFLVSEAKTGVNFPPIHPNCRSVTAPVIDWGDEDLWDFSGIELDDSDLAELGITRDQLEELDEEVRENVKGDAIAPHLTVQQANKAAEDTESVIRRAEQEQRAKAQEETLTMEIRKHGESIDAVESRLKKFEDQMQHASAQRAMAITAIDAEQLESIAIDLKVQELDALKLQDRVAKFDDTVPVPDDEKIDKLKSEIEIANQKRKERKTKDLDDDEIIKQSRIDHAGLEPSSTIMAPQSKSGKALESRLKQIDDLKHRLHLASIRQMLIYLKIKLDKKRDSFMNEIGKLKEALSDVTSEVSNG